MITIPLKNILEPVHLGEFPWPPGEEKALELTLNIADLAEDLTGWTIELYADGDLIKTITEASDPDADGIIDSPVSGQFYFTINRDDFAAYAVTNTTVKVSCRIRFNTGESSPPRVFSNVVLTIVLEA